MMQRRNSNEDPHPIAGVRPTSDTKYRQERPLTPRWGLFRRRNSYKLPPRSRLRSNGGLRSLGRCPPVLGLVALVCATGPNHQAVPPGTSSTQLAPTGISIEVLAFDPSGLQLGHRWLAVSALLSRKLRERESDVMCRYRTRR